MEKLIEQFKSDHFLANVDARVKLVCGLALLVMVLNYKGFVFPLLVALLCLALCIKLKVSMRLFALRFAEPLFIAAMVVLLKFLFAGHEVVFSIKISGINISGQWDGLMEGLLIASRITGAVSVVIVLGAATPFAETMAALSWLRMPKDLVEVMMFAYRYIFVLFEDAMVVYKAQKNRLGYSSMRHGLRSFGILSGSLVIKAFENSQKTTTAMLQRGYDGDMPMLKHRGFRPAEVAASLIFLILMGVAWRL